MAYAQEADGAHEPFLKKAVEIPEGDLNTYNKDDKNTIPAANHSIQRCHRQSSGIPTRHVLLHMILVALYTLLSAITIYALRYSSVAAGGVQTYSAPIWLPETLLEPAATVFSSSSPFTGPAPNDTIDAAWATLLQSSRTRATDDEITLSGVRSSVKSSLKSDSIPDNIVQLNVFHELQCLQILRQSVYRHIYYPQNSGDETQKLNTNADRCIESLRQSIMCRPDLTLEGLKWTAMDLWPIVDTRPKVRECVDWDMMISSLEGRMVSDEQMSHLTNPLRPIE